MSGRETRSERCVLGVSSGYSYTIVNGEVTFEGLRCTGATPGKLLYNTLKGWRPRTPTRQEVLHVGVSCLHLGGCERQHVIGPMLRLIHSIDSCTPGCAGAIDGENSKAKLCNPNSQVVFFIVCFK